ncbi:MAG: hypothetical protein C4547_06540 [Phycisphaerales bacterium]|nr:MAG: hypothetical protein C4547_06540 [Phycisphaerales bacterium]
MLPTQNELTERELADDFERIDRRMRDIARRYKAESYPPLTDVDDDSVVVQPVYAYDVHTT